MSSLRVATVQCELSADPAVWQRAFESVGAAAKDGACLVLLPEFMTVGYRYELATRSLAAPMDGPPVRALRALSDAHGVWLGTTVYEVRDGRSFNTFVLIGPGGATFEHRKSIPAFFESFLFEPAIDPFVFDTPLGRIALVVCLESNVTETLRAVAAQRPELVLITYACPAMPRPLVPVLGGPSATVLLDIGRTWARACDAPVVTSTPVGPWETTLPYLPWPKIRSSFYTQSAIFDRRGALLAEVGEREGYVVADVMARAGEPAASPPTEARWLTPLPRGMGALQRACEVLGSMSYERHRRAREGESGRGVAMPRRASPEDESRSPIGAVRSRSRSLSPALGR